MMATQPAQAARRDQATRLRELASTQGASRSGLMLAIVSGKGGVGKSSIAVNLSIALASRGLRVILVDADFGLANADILLNVQPRYTLLHVLNGLRTLEEVTVEAPGGVRFVPGGSGLEQLANLSEFERQNLLFQFDALRGNADIVVLDCGAGLGQNVVRPALSADRVLVVTTPQPTAMTDGYAVIKVLRHAQCVAPIGVCVNMAANRAQAAATHQRLSDVARRFLDYSVADFGFVLHDTSVEQAVLARCPFVLRYPASNATACIAAMAQELERGFAPVRDRGGLLRRVVGWFS